MKVNVLAAKNRLSQLLKAAQAGEDVVIANRGKPVVRLVPVAAANRKPGKGNGRVILDWLNAHPIPDYARRSEKEIEADIQEARNSAYGAHQPPLVRGQPGSTPSTPAWD